MKQRVLLSMALAVAVCLGLSSGYRPSAGAVPEAKAGGATVEAALGAKPKAGAASDDARFAWNLFIGAMKPLNGGLAVESWSEQCDFNPQMSGCASTTPEPKGVAGGKVRRGHGSALARKLLGITQNPASQVSCSSMNTAASSFKPKNLSASPIFCEEVFVNKAEASFVKGNGLATLQGQEKYGLAHAGSITFPSTAVEVKIDWVPASSFTKPSFSCPDPSNSLYTETIQFEGEPTQCYAMAGIHISSKVLPDWLWATFEPNSSVTNPNRCNGSLYDTCFDPWGTTSTQPYGPGQKVSQSQALGSAMAAAKLNPAFNNYFLTGLETVFVQAGKPVPLGSSFIEYNAGVAPGQASCITCHRYAYFDGQKPSAGALEDNFGGPPPPPPAYIGWPSVGYACNKGQASNCTPLVKHSVAQDFSWMLGLMPYSH